MGWSSQLASSRGRAAVPVVPMSLAMVAAFAACDPDSGDGVGTPPVEDEGDSSAGGSDEDVAPTPAAQRALDLVDEGEHVFRFDTFGSEAFWGGQVRLHESVAQISPAEALALGLKVDADALPPEILRDIEEGRVDLDDPGVTVLLLEQDAVVGVTGFFEAGKLTSIGIQCALCHSTVDDSVAPSIGRRLDGWPARDLDVGAIIASAPDLSPFADRLDVDEETVREVLLSWGPGRYDPTLFFDGQAFTPEGETAAVLLPPAFGFAGVSLHTYTGWGSVPYWNALVARLQMQGQGRFFDPRLDDPERFPVAAAAGLFDVRDERDFITARLPALHMYQLALPIPEPPEESFDAKAAERGQKVFEGQADCARCHVPPLFTEPGHNSHAPEDIGIDDFQASRSPDGRYRTTPLRGLFTRAQGGFYHDGRFADLFEVVDHYDDTFSLGLSEAQQTDLVEYLRSL